MSELYLNENGEHEVGNCTLDGIIKMLHAGWRVSRMYFRATHRINPVFLVERECFVPTFWYYWQPEMDVPRLARHEETPYHGSGWNTIYFIKENHSSTPLQSPNQKANVTTNCPSWCFGDHDEYIICDKKCSELEECEAEIRGSKQMQRSNGSETE